MRELDPADNREREETVKGRHQTGSPEKEEDGGSRGTSGGDLGGGKVRGFGDGNGSYGFHGLDRHGNVEE